MVLDSLTSRKLQTVCLPNFAALLSHFKSQFRDLSFEFDTLSQHSSNLSHKILDHPASAYSLRSRCGFKGFQLIIYKGDHELLFEGTAS